MTKPPASSELSPRPRSSAYQAVQSSLARGWNTWNTRSVLSHVLLPEGFALNLGLKEYRQGGHLREALIGRRNPGAEVIRPGTHGLDGAYTELGLSWRGIDIRVRTAVVEGDEWVALIEPEHDHLRPPLLVVEAGFLWNRRGTVADGGGELVGRAGHRVIRVFATVEDVAEPYINVLTPALALPLEGPVGLSTGRRRTLAEIAALIDGAAEKAGRVHARFGQHAELYRAIQAGLGWNTIYDPLKDRVVTPVTRLWNLGWEEPTVGEQAAVGDPSQFLGYVLFNWDTYFAGWTASLESRELAYANVIEITRERLPAGFVPMWYRSLGIRTQDRSQPPLGSLIVREIYRRFRERWLLEEVFDDLLAWNRWWPARRANKGYLSWGSEPYEPVVGFDWESKGVGDVYGAVLESGMDNLPLYDGVPYNAETHLLEVADVALLSFYVADCDALADIARVLGRTAEEAELRARGERFRTALQSLWSDERGIFLNLRTDTGEFTPRLSPTLFYPLLARAASPEQASRMVREHFYNPAEFWGDWIMPACARNDPAYGDNVYWRGRIWPPMNFLVYLGLRNYADLAKARADLAGKSKAMLMRPWRERGLVPENYNGDTGDGLDVTSSDHFYHWGGLLGFPALLEAALAPAPEEPLDPARE